MKFLFTFLFSLLIVTAYSQVVKIQEIKLKPNPQFLKVKYFTILYPIIKTKNLSSSKLINAEISKEILGSQDDRPVSKKDFKELLDDGLTDMSYTISFNKNGLLSINTYVEQDIANHLVRSESYFNFDTNTGQRLSITDLFNENMIDSFRQKVLADKLGFINKYKTSELKDNLSKELIDTASYNDLLGRIDEDCMNAIALDDFILSPSAIEIIDPCSFGSAATKWMEPDYKLKYSLKDIYNFLKPELLKKLSLQPIKSISPSAGVKNN